MKRLAIGDLEVALVLGCSVGSALAWGPPPMAAPPPPPVASLFAPPASATDKQQDKPAEKPAAPARKPASPAVLTPEPAPEKKPAAPPSQVDEAASQRDQELQTLLRRQKVCLQLMSIAAQTNDTELLRKAEQLDERAREVYSERTANLPGNRFESDTKTLEKHLGSINTASRPAAPHRMEEEQP